MALRPKAVSVVPQKEYKLLIGFDNGETRIFDVAPLIYGSWFGRLADPELFKTVRVGKHTIEWAEGQDVCPDDLYYLSVPVTTKTA